MSNPSVATIQLTAGVANGIALAQQPAAAGNLTLNGSLVTSGVANLVSTGATGRRVVVASTGNDANITFTVTGTNQSGAPISSPLTGVTSTNSVYTALDFATVTQIASSGATAGNITAGTNSVASTPWILDNFLAPTWNLAVAASIASGAGTYTIEHTYDDPNEGPPSLTVNPQQFSMTPAGYVPPKAWPNANLVNQSAQGEYQYTFPIMAHRLTVLTGTALFVLQSIQSGIGDP